MTRLAGWFQRTSQPQLPRRGSSWGTRSSGLCAATESTCPTTAGAWAPDIQTSAPLVALVFDGQAVAICGSVRITPRAHEAGVETAAPFRGRGYARAVVAAWSAAVRALDVEPLYSTTWQNTASRALARSLGLVSIGRDLHIT